MTKAEKTRQFIIEQSAAIINKRGVAGTSITDLMEATKLAKGGIYGNFESKEEICLEAFNYLVGRVTKELDTVANGTATAKERLFALLDHYQRVAGNAMGGCPLLSFGVEADDTNSAMKQRVAKAIKRSQSRIQGLVEQGKTSGEFGKKVNAVTFATKMFVMIEGAMFTTRVTNDPEVMKNIVTMLKKEIESF